MMADMDNQAVTRQKLNPFETTLHAFLTVATLGLWGVVWWARVRSRATLTTHTRHARR
jgi:hypothetical protein